MQLGQHAIDGADGTTDGAKLHNYRISCCKQPKKFGDEAESVVKAICSWDSITATYRWRQVTRPSEPNLRTLPQFPENALAYWKQRHSGTDKRLKTENSRNRKQQKQKTEEAV